MASYKDLQVLFLLLGLFLGHKSEIRAQTSGAASGIPAPANSTGGSWNVSLGRNVNNLTILTSPNQKFSFNLVLTNRSTSSCAAVVQHASSAVTVWVANFNTSTSGKETSACFLNFTKGVGLVLYIDNNQEIWRTNLSGNKGSLDLLQLDDTGSLYISNQGEKKLSSSLWKSFDYPTDTLVYEQQLKNGTSMSAALLNQDYSSGGIFHMGIHGASVTLSQSFELNGTSWDMPYSSWNTTRNTTTLSFVRMNNTLQAYGPPTATAKTDVLLFPIPNVSITGTWDYARLESNGGLVLKKFASQEQNLTLFPSTGDGVCSLPAECGSFGICRAESVPTCRCPDGFEQSSVTTGFTCQRSGALNCATDTFSSVTGRTYLDLSYSNVSDERVDAQGCQSRCLGNCNCTNALHVRTNATSPLGACFLNLSSMQTIQTFSNGTGLQTLFLRIGTPPGSSRVPSTRRTAALAFAGVSAALLLVLLGVSVWWLLHSRRKIFDDADKVGSMDPSPSELPPQLSYRDLVESTSNFNQRLGYGGFCSVYAGHLDSSKIAVKSLDDVKEKEFLAAMATLRRLSHPNLVPIQGFCNEGKHKLLVYELVNEGRSLNYFLFRPDLGPLMDAQTRRSIALETARGIAYLHDGVIHGGVKPENIMIDREMHPRLVDYGLVKLMSRFQRLNSANARGFRAYMAPEWARSPPITEKVDVYSFGVVMLELVSGRRCLMGGVPVEKRFLPTWGFSLLSRGPDRLLELVDPRLDVQGLSETDQQVLKGMTLVALWCVQEDAHLRPAMSGVVKMLEGDVAVDTPPGCSSALDALARDLLCAGLGDRSPDRESTVTGRPTENPPSLFHRPRMESESNSRHDLTWLLEKQQSL